MCTFNRFEPVAGVPKSKHNTEIVQEENESYLRSTDMKYYCSD